MKPISKIQLRMGKLKDEKQNLEFEISMHNNYFLAVLIFIATVAVASMSLIQDLSLRAISLLFYIGLMIALYLSFYPGIRKRITEIKRKAKEIQELYTHLLRS